eukprot:349602-Chlamydomonas_euryale.AAC.2
MCGEHVWDGEGLRSVASCPQSRSPRGVARAWECAPAHKAPFKTHTFVIISASRVSKLQGLRSKRGREAACPLVGRPLQERQRSRLSSGRENPATAVPPPGGATACGVCPVFVPMVMHNGCAFVSGHTMLSVRRHDGHFPPPAGRMSVRSSVFLCVLKIPDQLSVMAWLYWASAGYASFAWPGDSRSQT